MYEISKYNISNLLYNVPKRKYFLQSIYYTEIFECS